MRKISKNGQHFSFLNSFCFSFCIINKKKRNFVKLISELINNKLSVEYILESSVNFELLKKIILNEEQYENFKNLPYLTLADQMKEFNIE